MSQAPVSLPACVTLDAAGTLFHLRQPVGHTYAAIARSHGVHVQPEAVDKAFRAAWKATPTPLREEGRTSEDDDRGWWRTIVGLTLRGATPEEVPEPTVDTVFADLYAHFATAEPWALYEDTLPALELLRPHCRLLVLSNFDRRLLSILQGLGIRDYFEHVVISSDVGAYKPHPRIFGRVRELTGVLPENCVHVGDDERCDLAGARAAGMEAILLNRPVEGLREAAEKILSEGISCLRAGFS